ncbi:P-loop containing nucleoside triphosphate hydrolase protein [Halenospora varia]|nr:P-loop containing nucleoside triphosphate hydrolase protein [Halenospora varia]
MGEAAKPIKKVTLGIFGDLAVGKTAIVHRIVLDAFPEEYDPTIEETYRKYCKADGYILKFIDTSGSPDYSSLLKTWLDLCDGLILVYSISSPPSFQHIQTFHDTIIASSTTSVGDLPKLLIGNKADSERAVSKNDGAELARLWNCTFFEVSAKEPECRFEEPIYDLARQINSISRPIPGEGVGMYSLLKSLLWACQRKRKVEKNVELGIRC